MFMRVSISTAREKHSKTLRDELGLVSVSPARCGKARRTHLVTQPLEVRRAFEAGWLACELLLEMLKHLLRRLARCLHTQLQVALLYSKKPTALSGISVILTCP